MFSAGLPLLYPIAVTTFLVTYWVDKALILRFYKIPKPLPLAFSELVLQLAKYSVLPHFIMGYLMYSNSRILPMGRGTLSVYLVLFGFTILIFLTSTIVRLLCYREGMKKFRACIRKREKLRSQPTVLEEMSHRELHREFNRVKHELREYEGEGGPSNEEYVKA